MTYANWPLKSGQMVGAQLASWGCVLCSHTGSVLRRTSHKASCSVVSVLKFLIIFQEGVLHFHLADEIMYQFRGMQLPKQLPEIAIATFLPTLLPSGTLWESKSRAKFCQTYDLYQQADRQQEPHRASHRLCTQASNKHFSREVQPEEGTVAI